MTIYLNEDNVGSDPSEIVFPNLLLCMGMAAQMHDGTLIGAHISGASTEEIVLAELKSQIDSAPGTVTRYYMVTNFASHFGGQRKYSFTAKARAVGCVNGTIKVVDTASVIKETDGSQGHFVRLNSGGNAGPCSIYVHDQNKIKMSGFTQKSKIPVTCSVKTATAGGAQTPNWIYGGDNAPRPGTPVDEKHIKTAGIH